MTNLAWAQPPSRTLCVEQCHAQCCRAPGSITLSRREMQRFGLRAPERLVVYEQTGPRYVLNFSENGGQCPMLAEDATCRIYSDRPVCCHHFPEMPDPRCAVWPVTEATLGIG